MRESRISLNLNPIGKRKLCMRPVCWIILSISVTTFATSYLPSTPREWLENRAAAVYVAPGTPGNRIVYLSGESLEAATGGLTPRYRMLPLYPTDPTDATQIYDKIDSEDSFEMEKQNHNCSTKYKVNPTCNDVHTLDFLQDLPSNKTSVLSTKGYWRTAWTHDEVVDANSTLMVFKTMRIHHTFEEAYYEFQQLDALVMDRLTASPYVIDMYGFCGLSVLTDFAGKDISYVVDHTLRKDRLHLAHQVARGVADLHKSGIVHNDLNPANIAYSEKKSLPVLFDFNIAVLSDNSCPFISKYPNPQWRAPEEQALGNVLNEKVDIYGLGNIFFRFAVGESPWRGKGLRLSQEEKELITTKKLNGTSVPPYVLPLQKRDDATIALLEITTKCLAFHPNERPSALRVLSFLDSAIHDATIQEQLYPTPNVGKSPSNVTQAMSMEALTVSIGTRTNQVVQHPARRRNIRGGLKTAEERKGGPRRPPDSTNTSRSQMTNMRTPHTHKNGSLVY